MMKREKWKYWMMKKREIEIMNEKKKREIMNINSGEKKRNGIFRW